MYTVIDIGQLAKYGVTYWLPLASAANMSQGAACLAVAIRSKNNKVRSMAYPSALSCMLGITEPAIFGVNLRFMKPFIFGSIGGACGAMVCSVLNLGATATGVTGIFAILLTLNHPVKYIVSMSVAMAVAFILTFLFGTNHPEIVNDKKTVKEKQSEKQSEESSEEPSAETAVISSENTDDGFMILSPISGETVDLSDVPDETFAQEILGKGCAIIPSDNIITAPADAVVETIFDTHHAVGLKLENGCEMLIHVGINSRDRALPHMFRRVTK